MHSRQPPLPRLWLMTDERQGEALWQALGRLPRGAGVIFRHYSTPAQQRRSLFDKVARLARGRGLVLVLAGPPEQALAWGADGAHGPSPHRRSAGRLLRTAPAHDVPELLAAERAGADLILLSPVFPTRSHPGAPALGPLRFMQMARRTKAPVIALGGMNPKRARALPGSYGWAAIDAWGVPKPGVA